MSVFLPSQDGRLAVWAQPNSRSTYVMGADVAEGLEHGDYSCAHVLDAHSGAQVACWHGHAPADVFGEELDRIGRWYGGALIGVESNNHGLTTITRLRQLNYPNLYLHRSVDQITKQVTTKFGWPTNRVTKPLMVDDLDKAMRDGTIQIYDKHTLAELRTYVRDDRARMHGSPYDDRVMSLAIAVQMIPYALRHPETQSMGPARWTMDWWLAQARSADRAAKAVMPIGHFNQRVDTHP